MILQERKKIQYGILLTSSIRPNITNFSKRNDPKIRERDYREVLEALVKTSYPIVFCDNSDYPLENIKNSLSSRLPETYEVLQFDGSTFPPHLGKGYGELQIIKYAMNHSKILKECDFVVKITGRYSVQNITEILDAIQVKNDTMIIADYDKLSSYTYSGLFIAKPSFFFNYLFSFQEFLNDSEKRFFEHALFQAIQKVVNEGGGVLPFPVKPSITAISGTWNVRLKRGSYTEIGMSFTKMWAICGSYAKALLRRFKKFTHII